MKTNFCGFDSPEHAALTVATGIKIGRAIAQNVLAENMPLNWTGLDPQDVDQIPEGVDRELVERVAEDEYREILDGRPTLAGIDGDE